LLREDGGAADCSRLAMKLAGLLICLVSTAFLSSITLRIEPPFRAAHAMSEETPWSTRWVQSKEQAEVHAVVVDMPKVPSLWFASPDTWDDLPMSTEPSDQLREPGLAQQLALNVTK